MSGSEEKGEKGSDNKKKKIKEKYIDQELSETKPVWTRHPDEEYGEACKSLRGGREDHVVVKHCLLKENWNSQPFSCPKTHCLSSLWKQKEKGPSSGTYTVFITGNCEELVPECLNCITTLVGSEALPLNIVHEMLQQSKNLQVIRKNLFKKCLELFAELER
jgi:molecular chaperone HtpG